MKPRVLIYRSELLPLSETFIRAQARALTRYAPAFAGLRLLASATAVPGPILVPHGRVGRWVQQQTGFSFPVATTPRQARPRLMHAHFATDAAEALPLVQRLRLPLLVTLHGYDVMCHDDTHRMTRRGRLYLRRRRRLFERAHLFLCVSEAIREQAVCRGFPSDKLRVLPVGVDTDALAYRSELVAEPIILFIGRLVEKKGCGVLLEAMARLQRRLPHARLVIVGDGPLRSMLEAQAVSVTVGTEFVGAQDRDRVQAWLRRARCLAVPSVNAADGDAEGLPTVLNEALAVGLPVAATRHSGIPELVVDGEHGLLVPEHDPDALAGALYHLCTEDELAERLRSAGRARVVQHFNLRRQAERLEEVYDEASLRAPQPPGGRLRRDAAWMLGGNGVSMVCQAVYFVLIGRLLGAQGYGAFAGAVALVAVGTQFSSLGMEMVLLRTIARDPALFAVTWGRALAVSIAGCTVLLSVLAASRRCLPPGLWQILPLVVFADALFGKLTQLASRALQGAAQSRWSAKLQAATNAARMMAAAALTLRPGVHHTKASLHAWAMAYAASSAGVAVFAFGVVTRRLGLPRASAVTRRHLSEGLAFSFSSSSISVYNDVDKALLASEGTLGATGVYAAAYRIIDALCAPLYSVFAAASPRMFRAGAERGAAGVAEEVRRLGRWTSGFGVLAVPLVLLIAPLAPRLFGQSFAGSAEVLRWLCILPLLRAWHYSFGTAITACANQWWRTATQASIAVMNLGLNLWLIPLYGWRGAAAASLLSDGGLALLSWIVVRSIAAQRLGPLPA